MRLLGGHDRVQCQFIRDKYNRVTVPGFVSKENLITHRPPSPRPVDAIVLMIRDPIARVVSECFHKVKENEMAPCPDDMDAADWVLAVGDHSAMLDHVIYEVFAATGFDVLSIPFRPPVMFYATKPLIIACRLKDIDELPVALRDNGVPVFERKVTRENTCSYPELRFPKCYVDRMMNNAYTRHFYNDDEINEMSKKWRNI